VVSKCLQIHKLGVQTDWERGSLFWAFVPTKGRISGRVTSSPPYCQFLECFPVCSLLPMFRQNAEYSYRKRLHVYRFAPGKAVLPEEFHIHCCFSELSLNVCSLKRKGRLPICEYLIMKSHKELQTSPTI